MVGVGAAYIATGIMAIFALYIVARITTLGVMQSIHSFNKSRTNKKEHRNGV
jgi:hypothetical protein